MIEKPRRTWRARWLASLLVAVAAVFAVPATAWAAGGAVYVGSTNAADADDHGATAEAPYASLKYAVEHAEDGDTIYVVDDITVTETAYYENKHLTITSADSSDVATITRGDNFSVRHNTALGYYNGALIEVAGNQFNFESSLTLSNIILDDAGMHEGTRYVQADTNAPDSSTTVGGTEVNNSEIVQDAIITTANNTATITLGSGTVLRNYGGMSAVRISGGKLVMESGSKIVDTQAVTRTKGATSDYGVAGAVWLQPGGIFDMQQGSYIGSDVEGVDMIGRGVYVDGGDSDTAKTSATVNGELSNIKGSKQAWQSDNGVAVHTRGLGVSTVGVSTVDASEIERIGLIESIEGNTTSSGSVLYTSNGKLDFGGTVQDCSIGTIANIDSSKGGTAATLSGAIQNNTLSGGNGYGIIFSGSQATMTNTFLMDGNTSAVATVDVSSGSDVEFYGTISNNTASSQAGSGGVHITYFWAAGNDTTFDMYPGASITKNSSVLGSAAVNVTSGNGAYNGVFTMHGGTISENTSLLKGAVTTSRHGQFVMEGGEICKNTSRYAVFVNSGDEYNQGRTYFEMRDGSIHDNNGEGVFLIAGSKPFNNEQQKNVRLLGGEIYSNDADSQVAVSDGSATDSVENALVSSGVLTGAKTVSAAGYSLTLDENYADASFGRADNAAKNKITELIAADPSHDGWTVVGSNALWIKPTVDDYHFTMVRPSSALMTGIFAAYIPLDADGTPMADAELTLVPLENEQSLDVTLEGTKVGTSYAVMLVNNKEYTLAPDDVTIYTGGGQGSETSESGFPVLTISDSVDPIESLVIDNGAALSGDAAMNALLERLAVSYYDGDSQITNDRVAGEYEARLSWKEGQKPQSITINGNEVAEDFGTGTLVVRYVEDVSEAVSGDRTYTVQGTAPTEMQNHAVAFIDSGAKYYLNGDENSEVTDASGVSILDDSLLTSLGDNRQRLLEQRAANEPELLPALGAGQAYRFAFRYLDLVDANNGNAWVSADKDATIYLPYPDGMTYEQAQGIDFTVVHFKDLHREYEITGPDVETAIANCELEKIDCNKTEQGISFTVGSSGFSPFAVVWQTDAYTITANAGAGGSIDPSGPVTVAEGADQSFTITPNQGYQISDVKVDGTSVGAVESYTFDNVQGDHTIEATFRSTSGGGGGTTKYYEIEASAGEGGSISPSGTVRVAEGADRTFTITPDEGWAVGDVVIDGVSYRQLGSYTFEDVDRDHTISVTFMRGDEPVSPDETGVSDWLETTDHLAYLRGYGDGSGTFGPENPMTRAEVAQMFYNLLLDKSMGERPVAFEDVPEGAYYEEAVRVLASRGIVNGTSPESFEPNRAITRAEFVAIAMRFSDGEFEGENIYVDVAEDAWYRDYVVGATGFGWIYGYQDGSRRFGPDDTITRGQATMVVNRMLWRSCDTVWALAHLDELKTFKDLGRAHYAFFDVVEATNAHEYGRVGETRYESWTGLVE